MYPRLELKYRCMITVPDTVPVPVPSIKAVWLDVDSKVKLPPAFNVPLQRSMPAICSPDVLMVVVLPDLIVILLNIGKDDPPNVCVTPLKRTVPPLAVNVPLFVQL